MSLPFPGVSGARLQVIAAGFIASLLISAAQADDTTPWQWKQEPGQSVALTRGETVVWQFRYASDQPKPFFHPLSLPDGPVLTWNRPPDHPWHHALWFSWKFLNGVNYWEPNRSTGQPDGRTQWSNARIATNPDHTATIEMDLTYRPSDQPVVLTEKRVVEVSCPDASGRYHFDWSSTFTAGETDVEFSRTPLPGEPGGKAWGGYAGLSVRLAKELSERAAAKTDGPVDFGDGSTHRSRSTAMDYNGLIDGRPVGIAVCDHPDNVNHPSPWYAIASQPMSYFSPAVICYGSHTLPAGESFVLKYRVIVHQGRWDAAKLQQEFRRFVEDKQREP
jgi:hypothetical protein